MDVLRLWKRLPSICTQKTPQVGLSELVASACRATPEFNPVLRECLDNLTAKNGIRLLQNQSKCVVAAARKFEIGSVDFWI
jgi:hypothetical protein